MGHSSGEISAAYAAGAFGMKEALLISYYRGIAASQLRRPGAMGAIGLGREDIKDLLVGNVTLACENSRKSVTISGDLADVESTLNRVSEMRPEVLARKLKINRAYHSGKSYRNKSSKYGEITSLIIYRSYASCGGALRELDGLNKTKAGEVVGPIFF